MAKQAPKKKISVNRKLVAALTLVVALVLSVAFIVLGFTGRNMDAQGLYKLLPWLPSTAGNSSWRQALAPGASLGETQVATYLPATEGEVKPEDLDKAVQILSKRLADYGYTDVAVKQQDGKVAVTLPAKLDAQQLATLLTAKGEYAFADPDGKVFMDGSMIIQSGFGYADNTGKNIALSMLFDAKGKELFGQKSTELAGKSISLMRDGQVLVSPSIGEPITEGQVSIPGFDLETARENAVLLRSGPLPFGLTAEGESQPGAPLLGQNTQTLLLYALLAVFVLVALYFIIRHRLGGLLAAWMLALQLAFSFFFAALISAGFNLLSLSAILLGFIATTYALLRLHTHVGRELLRGRGLRQALKEAYAGPGHAGLDVLAGLLLASVVLIIMNQGMISTFSQIFAVTLLLGLVIVQLLHRVLFSETLHLVGDKASLFAGSSAPRKEA